jgi:hypothetical protein
MKKQTTNRRPDRRGFSVVHDLGIQVVWAGQHLKILYKCLLDWQGNCKEPEAGLF